MPTARQRPCAFIAERERYIDRKTICFKCIRERRGQADVHLLVCSATITVLPAIVTRSDALPLHDVENPGRRIAASASWFAGQAGHQDAVDDTPLVEPDGIEPTTSCLQSTRSPN